MSDIMKIVKSLKLLIKGVSKKIKSEPKNNKENFSQCY